MEDPFAYPPLLPTRAPPVVTVKTEGPYGTQDKLTHGSDTVLFCVSFVFFPWLLGRQRKKKVFEKGEELGLK